MPREFVLGTAGHIDHGKTSLVRRLTGVDTDRLPAEKERGISIDIGFAKLDLPGNAGRLGIVDVPGHERFIKNMVAGASGIDIALLVVAADDSVMPQTREHLAILELLDVHAGIIAITKIDAVDAEWVPIVQEDIRELVRGTFLENAPIIATSAKTGDGYDDLTTAIAAVCDSLDAPERTDGFRFPIDRVFTKTGMGTVVTGTVWSGSIHPNDEVAWLPDGRTARVRNIERFGAASDVASRGQRAALNIDLHHTDITRGQELATPGSLLPARRLSVRLRLFSHAPAPLAHRARVHVHLGTQQELASVRLLESDELAPGASALAQLVFEHDVVAAPHQPFVVRAESPMITIGGGLVLQTSGKPISRRNTNAIGMLRRLATHDTVERIAAAVWFRGFESWTPTNIAHDAGIRHDEVGPALTRLEAAEQLVALSDGLRLHENRWDRFRTELIASIQQHHDDAPREAGAPRSKVATAFAYLDARILHAAIERLEQEGTVGCDARLVWLTSFRPNLTAEEQKAIDAIISLYESAKFSPPTVDDLATHLGKSPRQTRELIRLCADQDMLRHVGGDLLLHPAAVADLEQSLRAHLEEHESITMSGIRDLLGTTRKYAVPIGEFCDRIGITKRRGDVRVLA